MERDMTSPGREKGPGPIGYVLRHAWPNSLDSSSIVLAFAPLASLYREGINTFIWKLSNRSS